jgi:hypothetical protein
MEGVPPPPPKPGRDWGHPADEHQTTQLPNDSQPQADQVSGDLRLSPCSHLDRMSMRTAPAYMCRFVYMHPIMPSIQPMRACCWRVHDADMAQLIRTRSGRSLVSMPLPFCRLATSRKKAHRSAMSSWVAGCVRIGQRSGASTKARHE